jgi:hypothetical protein
MGGPPRSRHVRTTRVPPAAGFADHVTRAEPVGRKMVVSLALLDEM